MTATLAGEVVKDGITVNCVSPAGIESEADGDTSGAPRGFRDPTWTPPQVLEQMMKMSGVATAIGRLAHPTEVVSTVAFLGSREAAYVTGQHLDASGGVAMFWRRERILAEPRRMGTPTARRGARP